MKRVGYFISEKKSKKLNFDEHRPLFRNAGIDLVKIDLSQALDTQGPFDAIIHKVTDILAKANNGNLKARQYIHNIESYTERHPDCILLDPVDSTRQLLDRYRQYQQVSACELVCRDHRVIIPSFVELTTTDVEENKQKLAEAGVTFPILIKPSLAHGSKLAHEMAIIFNKENLQDVEVPCVAQSFLNHNALLYKIFVVGNRQFVVLRPSLKNLYPGNHPTIFFDTQEVSKPGSSHPLNEVDVETIDEPLIKPDWKLLEQLGASISKAMSMTLLGIDVIIDSETQHYAVIDINAFPGFEGVDDFFTHLLDHVLEQLGTKDKDNCDRPIRPTTTPSAIPTINPASSTTTRQERLAADEKATGSNKKTAAVNAANLKASQGMYIVDQSRLIDCSHRIDGESIKSDRPSLRVGDVGGDEGAEKMERLSQRRSKDAADSQGAH